jgi:hypothetical protein
MATPSEEIRSRLNHVITLLAEEARRSGPVGDWRDLWLMVTLANHELEACLQLIRRQFP